MSPFLLAEPYPFWFRYYCSFAAPLFIFVAGMMVAFTAETKGHSLKYFLIRGSMIVAVGIFIDVFIWKTYPFVSFDALYLIGISVPLSYLFLRLHGLFRWFIIIFIFLSTPVLQKILGYSAYPDNGQLKTIFRHWVIDGYFPLFPWLGFCLLGSGLKKNHWRAAFGVNPAPRWCGIKVIFLSGLAIFIFGSIIWRLCPIELLTREGYGELFYPATLGYLISAIGLIFLVFSIIDLRPSAIYRPFQALGESSLFIYVLHLFLIEYVLTRIWPKEDFQIFFIIYIVLLFFLISMAYVLRRLKAKWKDRPFIINFLFGS